MIFCMMSTRELQQVIKEKQELELKLSAAEDAKKIADASRADAEKRADREHQAWQSVSDSYNKLEKTNRDHYETVKRLEKELEKTRASGDSSEVSILQEQLKEANNDLDSSAKRIDDLEAQLKEQPIATRAAVEKIPEEVERELTQLRRNQNSAIPKFAVQFQSLVSDFGYLLGILDEIKETDADDYGRYRNAVSQLIEKMSERL
jgi:chromosome segregation ATPase